MKQAIPILATIVLVVVVAAVSALTPKELPAPPLAELRERYSKERAASVDHSRFAQLQREFKSPQEVTEACIGCHNGRHVEVMNSNHWRWEREEYVKGRGVV
ncbi:MAG: cytochrome C, partial [bacterium]|nr:cytochrome C [bacterium]